MARRQIKITGIGQHCEEQVKELVREATVMLRDKLVEYSPTDTNIFVNNWQPPVYVDKGLTGRVVNITQKYGEAITFGINTPPSWGPPGSFKSRFGLEKDWPTKLAGKDVQNAIPSMWRRIVSKA